MSAQYTVNSQDWYRVRRGEDQIAWGLRWRAQRLPETVFSERARDEFAFLKPEQRAALQRALREMTLAPDNTKGQPVCHGQGRRVLLVDDLRVIFRVRDGAAWISTIRGGPVLDPEHTGPAPDGEMDWSPA